MSKETHVNTQPKAEFFEQRHAGNLPLVLPAVGALALIVSLVWGIFFNPAQLAYSWLFAFTYFFTLVVGSLFWVLVHHTTDAEWSVVVRRVLENVAALMPWLALAVIPVLLYHSILFKWWNIPHGLDEVLDKKRGYLNHEFFFIRTVLYFVLLSLVAWKTRKNSVLQDADGHPKYTISMRTWSFFGVPVLGLTLTFGAFDWLMGLDYKWFSTMWGVYIFAGTAGSGMCLLVLIVTALRNKGYLPFVTMEHYHIMGKLMLTFCIFWAYIGFDQYMLYWYVNIPEETSYFIRRNIGSWWFWSTFLVVFRFIIPFPLLLIQNLKKNPKYICMAAGWLLFMQIVDIYIVVMPMLHQYGFAPHPLDLLTLIAIGAPLAFIFIKNLGKDSLFPVRDPRLERSIKLTN
ncbi:MAG: hypothetical protein WCD79_16290 [Chthoniobacteraceae bacterium]